MNSPSEARFVVGCSVVSCLRSGSYLLPQSDPFFLSWLSEGLWFCIVGSLLFLFFLRSGSNFVLECFRLLILGPDLLSLSPGTHRQVGNTPKRYDEREHDTHPRHESAW